MSGQRRTGTVEPLPSGRFSVRLSFPGGRRERLPGTYATRAEAECARDVALEELGPDGEASLATIADDFHDGRELGGIRSHDDGRSIWKTWIATAPFYRRPLRHHNERDVKKWALGIWRQRAEQTAKNALNLLRTAYEYAREEEYLHGPNPALNVRLPKKDRTDDPWTYLTPTEIPGKLVELATPEEWDLIAFGWGTGLRAGEQRSLLLRDLHVKKVSEPHVVVRFGNPGKPPKNGKQRVVPLFGPALAAAERWLDRLPTYCEDNDRGLAFPTPRGAVRHEGRLLGRVGRGYDEVSGKQLYSNRFTDLVHAAGLFKNDPERPLVWHSLRHTCASWCVSGWWGRRWSLEEVKELLGHQSITTTERYAHLGETVLRTAARETRSAGGSSSVAAISSVHELSTALGAIANRLGLLSQPWDLNPRPAVYEVQTQSVEDRAVTTERGQLVDEIRAGVLARDDAGVRERLRALALRELAASPASRLALEVLAGGPHMITRGLDLVDELNTAAIEKPSAEAAS